jgi:hypothetical protein
LGKKDPSSMNAPSEHEIVAYEMSFESKHHYDNLSWTALGVAMVICAAIATLIPTIQAASYLLTVVARLGPAILGCITLWAWRQIYGRNRFWAEVSNEAIRDFERRFQVEGVGLAFMRASAVKEVTLKNTGLRGESISQPVIERCSHKSIHFRVPYLAWAAGIVLILACFVPPEGPNKAPEPTPGSVTPRAIEGASK